MQTVDTWQQTKGPDAWDLSQSVADLLHQQDGLQKALTERIAALNLPPREEDILYCLLLSMHSLRERAMEQAARVR